MFKVLTNLTYKHVHVHVCHYKEHQTQTWVITTSILSSLITFFRENYSSGETERDVYPKHRWCACENRLSTKLLIRVTWFAFANVQVSKTLWTNTEILDLRTRILNKKPNVLVCIMRTHTGWTTRLKPHSCGDSCNLFNFFPQQLSHRELLICSSRLDTENWQILYDIVKNLFGFC